MAISPFKHKHDTMDAYKGVQFIELRCLKDGSRRKLVLDGPFPTTPNWQRKTPQSGTANVLYQIRKREVDPILVADDKDATVPVFVFDGVDKDGRPLPLPKIWDPRIGQFMSPERMSDHHRKCMEIFLAQRNAVEIRANERRAQLQAEAEAKANAGLEALVGALGERLGRAAAPPKKVVQP
jgi:hypothetical protein